MIVSVVAHGIAATPIMDRLDRVRRAEGRDVGPAPGIAGDDDRPRSGAAEN